MIDLAPPTTANERLVVRALTIGRRTALGVLGDREAAADVAQEVALIALQKAGVVRDLDPWLHKVAVRRALKEARRNRDRRDAEARAHRPRRPDDPLAEPSSCSTASRPASAPRSRCATSTTSPTPRSPRRSAAAPAPCAPCSRAAAKPSGANYDPAGTARAAARGHAHRRRDRRRLRRRPGPPAAPPAPPARRSRSSPRPRRRGRGRRAARRQGADATPSRCCAPPPRPPPTRRPPSPATATPRCSSTGAGKGRAEEVEQRVENWVDRDWQGRAIAHQGKVISGREDNYFASRTTTLHLRRRPAASTSTSSKLPTEPKALLAALEANERDAELGARAADRRPGPLRHHLQRAAAARHRQHDARAALGAVGRARADARAAVRAGVRDPQRPRRRRRDAQPQAAPRTRAPARSG